MKRIFLLVVILMLMSGCATVNKTYTADGKEAYALNCSGTARGWDKCLKAAGDLCGARGYNILDRSSEDMAVSGADANGFFATKTNERSMLITCK